MAEELKRTPLYDMHVKYGGKVVPYAGWGMAVHFPKGQIEEHLAVRKDAGIFDVSHMAQIEVKGPDAHKFVNYMLSNDFSDFQPGVAKYSLICNEEGGCVDDCIAYCKSKDYIFIVVNASNREKDVKWFMDHKQGDIEITDLSDSIVEIAVQGPKATDIMKKVCGAENVPTEYYHCIFDVDILGHNCMVATTGYTGEGGGEIYVPAEGGIAVYEALMEAGKDYGLTPCGLGARDTLRLEAGMPLYGHEIDNDITPHEAGLGMFANLEQPGDFIGKAALVAAGKPKRRKIGLKVTGRGIVREHMDVYKNGKKVGFTCSGTYLPYLDGAYATAIVDDEAREMGSTFEVDVRGRKVECEQVKAQFYKRNY